MLAVDVVAARPVSADFGAGRPEMVPGADDPRRVVRLECNIEISITPAANAGRAQTIAGLDALLYLLEAPELKRPETLTSPADDPGFVLESMQVEAVLVTPAVGMPRVELAARGWFWPPNAPGVSGAPITATHIRSAQLPVSLTPWPLHLRAGGDAVSLVLDTRSVGTILVDGDTVEQEAFGAVVLRLLDEAGRPGAGTLSGGVAGPAGSRLMPLNDGRATVDYRPPDIATVDQLMVSLARNVAVGADGADSAGDLVSGIELARFALEVEA